MAYSLPQNLIHYISEDPFSQNYMVVLASSSSVLFFYLAF